MVERADKKYISQKASTLIADYSPTERSIIHSLGKPAFRSCDVSTEDKSPAFWASKKKVILMS